MALINSKKPIYDVRGSEKKRSDNKRENKSEMKNLAQNLTHALSNKSGKKDLLTSEVSINGKKMRLDEFLALDAKNTDDSFERQEQEQE
jgi:hypothetical protein